MNLQPPLFWSTWSQARGQDSAICSCLAHEHLESLTTLTTGSGLSSSTKLNKPTAYQKKNLKLHTIFDVTVVSEDIK